MTTNYRPTLRERLIAKRNHSPEQPAHLELPESGTIPAEAISAIEVLAQRATCGDIAALDQLYAALQPRLHRKGFVVRPWPNSPKQTGIWDRDDVQQECWLIFAELLAAWDGEVPFVPYLFSRFAWRLRDRILRGIGRPLPPMGAIRVPEDLLVELLSAHDSDQPESALLAKKLIEHLLQGKMRGEIELLDPSVVLTILQSPRFRRSRESSTLPDDDHPFSQMEVA